MRASSMLLFVAALAACAGDSSTGPGGTNPLAGYHATPPGPTWPGTAVAVTVSTYDTCLLMADGTPWCWGNTASVAWRIDDGIRSWDPSKTAGWYRDSICLANTTVGQVPGWPCNVFHPIRLGTKVLASVALPVNDGAPCGVDAAGAAYCWDQGPHLNINADSMTNGVAWCGQTLCLYAPQAVRGGQPIRDILLPCTLSTAGVPLCLGFNSFNLMGNRPINFHSDTLVAVIGAPASTALAVSPSGNFACSIATANSKAYCWGWNETSWGVGVDSTGNQIATPKPVASTLTFKSIATALWTACAIATAGPAYCWGDGRGGVLGWGGNGFSFAPVAVAGGHTFTSIIAGPAHFCALDGGGAAWCWGNNNSGELGVSRAPCDGATFCSSSPVQVSGGHTFTQLSAGPAQTCGVTTAHEVYCWGSTKYGRLGPAALGTDFSMVSTTPVKITP